jgi:hypothetical protein
MMRIRPLTAGLVAGVLVLTSCAQASGPAADTTVQAAGERPAEVSVPATETTVQAAGQQPAEPSGPATDTTVQAAGERPAQVVLASNDVKSLRALNDIEDIEELKARYCRLLDTKDWKGWRGVFADDFVSDTSDEPGGKVIEGADPFVAFVRENLGQASQTTSHQVHMPEIELTSATTAKGIWAVEDYVDLTPALGMHGHGHYHETYVKVDGKWLISSSKLTRIRQEIITPASGVGTTNLEKAVEDALGQ